MDIYDFLLTARPTLISPTKLTYDEHTLEFTDLVWVFDPGGPEEKIVDKNWYDIAVKLAQYPERIEHVHILPGDEVICKKVVRPSLVIRQLTRLTVVGIDYETQFDKPTWRMKIHATLLGSPMQIYLKDVFEVWRAGSLFYSLREFPQ